MPPPPTPVAKEELSLIQALWGAITNAPIGYFPRVDGTPMAAGMMARDAKSALSELQVEPDALKDAVARARESLNEVKALTEYQDQKATRLLTIMTFLTALAGVLFGRMADTAPFEFVQTTHWTDLRAWLVAFAYLGFFAYIFCVISGALITFKATETRFKYPEGGAPADDGEPSHPRSHVFYEGILFVSPTDWAKSFLKRDNPTKLDPSLQLQYLKDYISESYLIAAKVADKLRYLVPGQKFLQTAIRILLAWIFLFALTLVFVSPPAETSPQQAASSVAMERGDASSPSEATPERPPPAEETK